MHSRLQGKVLAAAMAVGILVAACGDDGGDDGGGGPDASPGDILPPPPTGKGFQIGLDVDLEPGGEIEYCRYFALPGEGELDVQSFEHAYSRGSHHLLVYQTRFAASEIDDEVFPCAGASFDSLGVTGVAYAAQVDRGALSYPDGVALKMRAGDVVLLQTHYLNASDDPLEAKVRLNFRLADAPAAVEAGTLFFYDWAIVVPPNQQTTARMSCAIPEDANILFGMSHMHRRGVGYRSWLAGADLAEPEELVSTTRWENVEPTLFDPVKQFRAGQRVDFECDYTGESSRTIIEGPSAVDNEMCMFIAAYYPRMDRAAEVCRGPGSGPVLDGGATCAATLACVQGTDDPIAAEACILDTCSASADPTRGLMSCLFNECQAVCAGGGDECQACVTGSCASELQACLKASCE
jgi:hypothetical protein